MRTSKNNAGQPSSIAREYYRLTKPGIIYGNTLTAIAGFLLASGTNITWSVLVATVAGVVLLIACGCVFNNILDRGIDARMARTKTRALVTGAISAHHAALFGATLGVLGLAVLLLFVSLLVATMGIVAVVWYVAIYGYAKRHTIHGTLVGTVPGAMSLVAGYTAAAGELNLGTLLLFIIMVTWQMPHFYAIALYRKKEYAATYLPIISLKKSLASVAVQIRLYIILYLVAVMLLWLYGYANGVYLVVMLVAGSIWLRVALRNYRGTEAETVLWAKRVFKASLLVLLIFCTAIAASGLLTVVH